MSDAFWEVFSGFNVGRFDIALFSIIGPTKALSWQRMTNVISGVFVGTVWATVIAFVIGVVRNALGLDTIYAFPDSVLGAILNGVRAYNS